MSDIPTREQETEEIAHDARSEKKLVWQALAAFAVVAVIVVVRELLLR
ncbi:hypothetical protein [uncultured Microbacterium sp.]|nr:hypothetical protein [uncultured Microbacterium sp.]